MNMAAVREQLASQGFAWLRSAISIEECQQLKSLLAAVPLASRRGGVRHIDQQLVEIRQLALSGAMAHIASQFLDSAAYLVRSIWFDKTPLQNWLVAWHQDITVTAAQRFERAGWGPWSEKDGVLHVQPPVDVLMNMLTFRLHLDPATLSNGCLKVAAGSHRRGIQREPLSIDEAQVNLCEADVGDILLMSPLLWHASSKASQPSSRQVLHFEYSNHHCAIDLAWQPLETV